MKTNITERRREMKIFQSIIDIIVFILFLLLLLLWLQKETIAWVVLDELIWE